MITKDQVRSVMGKYCLGKLLLLGVKLAADEHKFLYRQVASLGYAPLRYVVLDPDNPDPNP